MEQARDMFGTIIQIAPILYYVVTLTITKFGILNTRSNHTRKPERVVIMEPFNGSMKIMGPRWLKVYNFTIYVSISIKEMLEVRGTIIHQNNNLVTGSIGMR